MNAVLRRLGAVAIMAVGGAGVLGLVVWMNSYAERPARAPARDAVALQVAPPPPPPRKEERPRTPPRRPRRTETPRPRTPPPDLSSTLSGVALGSPIGDLGSVSTAGDRLLGAPQRDLVMTNDAVDDPPRELRCPAPGHPEAARRRGLAGQVTLSLLIGADGAVERVKVVRAEPPGVFEDAARTAMEGCRFAPARYQGAAVRTWATKTIRFQLGNG